MEYAWICGLSATGKQRLIDTLCADDSDGLRAEFRLPDSLLDANSHLLGNQPGGLAACVARLKTEAVLIKWQFQYHCEILTLVKLRSAPEYRHRLVLLWLPPEKHIAYFRLKYPCHELSRTLDSDAVTKLQSTFADLEMKLQNTAQKCREFATVCLEIRDASTAAYEIRNYL